MNALKTILLAFSMFSSIPVRKVEWTDENMRGVLSALPLVGLAVGAAVAIWAALCRLLSVGTLLTGAGLTVLPIAVTGGIHLDGFADTVDALSSHASAEKKREIMKDPRAGAFAVIWTGAYLLCYFSAACSISLDHAALLLITLVFVFARALSALVVTRSGAGSEYGLLSTFERAADKNRDCAILTFMCLLTAACMLIISWQIGCILLLSGLLSVALCGRMAKRAFGGFTGDLAGFTISISELAMLLSYAMLQRTVIKWF